MGDPDPLLGDSANNADDVVVPQRRYRSIIVSVTSFILVTEMCERLAYYGLTGSLPIFFRKNLGIDFVLATELNSLFSSVNYITPLLGAWLADTKWGRYKTILRFCVLYVFGMAGCCLAAYPGLFKGGDQSSTEGSTATAIFLLSLFLGVALGSGGIKPNVVTLGADQFDLRDPSQVEEKDRFFNYFYWSINIGATISFGYLAQLAVNGQGDAVPERYGFFASFSIPAFCMVLALLTFIIGTPRYVCLPPQGSALSDFFAVFLKAGWRSRNGRAILCGCFVILVGMVLTIASYFVESSSAQTALAICALMSIVLGNVVLVCRAQTSEWLEAALDSYSSEDDVHRMSNAAEVCRLLPYLCFLIMFWACYGQMSNNFQIQGCQMNLHWNAGTTGGQVSPAFQNIFDSVVIMIFIPIFDAFLYPLIERAKGSRFTIMQKIGTGFVFCALAMICAAIMEIYRKTKLVYVPLGCRDDDNGFDTNGTYFLDGWSESGTRYWDQLPGAVFGHPLTNEIDCDPETYECTGAYIESSLCPYNSVCSSGNEVLPMSRVSIWLQIPQFLLIGVGEIFTSISSYELFYSQVPTNMRSVCQALNLLTTSIGLMVTGGVNSMFKSFIPNDINTGELEYVFFFVAGLTIVCLVSFIKVSGGFVYKEEQKSLEDALASGFTPDAMTKGRHRLRSTEGDDLLNGRRTSFADA